MLVAVAVAAALFVVIIVVWPKRGDGAPTEKEVSQRLVDAISAASSTSGGDPTGIFDTRQLRTTLEGQLSGWVIDLAASDDRRRVGVSARRLGDFLCVFAWSDVGAPQTATVTDIRLPCFAAMALQAAKNPA